MLPLAKPSDVVEVVDARGGEGDGGCLGEVASQISLPGLDVRRRHQVRLWGGCGVTAELWLAWHVWGVCGLPW